MLFMVIEKFKNGEAKPIYQRFLENGRSMPENLIYRASWVEANLNRCFQLVECDDARLLQKWTIEWQDLVEFEIVPVVESKETFEAIKEFL